SFIQKIIASDDGTSLGVEVFYYSSSRTLPSALAQWTWLSRLIECEPELRSDLIVFDSVTRRRVGALTNIRYGEPHKLSPDLSMCVLTREGTVEVWQLPPRKPVWLAVALAALFVGMFWSGRTGYRWFDRNAVAETKPVKHDG